MASSGGQPPQGIPVTHEALGDPLSTENKILTGATSATQDFAPLKNVCAHLNAFHVYASEPHRYVETTHFCAPVNDEVRQCLLYESADKNARLIGIEYMISPRLYETLDSEERKLWHSHVFEVKSGMLILPRPLGVPAAIWEEAENKEMEQVIQLYGKTYHMWQVDRGDKLPVGPPKLMMSFTRKDQFDFETAVGKRDMRYGEDWRRKEEIRRYIPVPEIHPDADQWPRTTKSEGGDGEV